jgi:hypothetical protein
MGTTGVDFAFPLIGDRGGMGGPLEVGRVCVCMVWEGPAVCVGLGSLGALVRGGGRVGCFPLDMGGIGT